MARTPQKVTIPNQESGLVYKNPSSSELEYAHGLSGSLNVRETAVPAPVAFGYERVEASATNQALGATGAIGDFLHSIVVDGNTNTIVVKDDGTVILTIPAGFELSKPIILDVASQSGAFTITTGLTTTCLCIGTFT